jgi:hypothetical protein
MSTQTNIILQSLAPGVALTSVIFYNTSLQNRMVFIIGHLRALNSEARRLQAEDPISHGARIRSIRWQVDVLTRRVRIIRHAVLIVYASLFFFLLTILELLAIGTLRTPSLNPFPLATFVGGFLALGIATLVSSGEMTLAQRTIMEDIRSSYGPDFPPAPSPNG